MFSETFLCNKWCTQSDASVVQHVVDRYEFLEDKEEKMKVLISADIEGISGIAKRTRAVGAKGDHR